MPIVGAKGKGKARDPRRSWSRNTTPSSAGTNMGLTQNTNVTTAFLETPLAHLLLPTQMAYDEILDRFAGGSGIPDAKNIDALATDMRRFAQLAENRGRVCDKGMRELSKKRKEAVEQQREREWQDREFEERQEKLRRESAAKAEDGAAKDRKTTKARKVAVPREERPLTHGAHGLARQDGLPSTKKEVAGVSEAGKPLAESELAEKEIKPDGGSVSSSSFSPQPLLPVPTAAASMTDRKPRLGSPASESSLSDRQPTPAPAVPQYQTFGPDPTKFPDPTIYHIREVTPGMSEEQKKDIYFVAQYPHDDLNELIPGSPPDRDLSNAKPPNQVAANTFATYLEPYFRPFNEEDLAFLREKVGVVSDVALESVLTGSQGDRVQPFVIPPRGKRHYTEIWAEEDGIQPADGPNTSARRLAPNQARGSIEQMNDEVAESDQVSAGPMLSRMLAAMRPERRPLATEEQPANTGLSNSNTATQDLGGEAMEDVQASGDAEKPAPLPAATFIPDSTQPGWKVPNTKLDYMQTDERLKQELRFIGFLGEDEEPDYDAHYDDEIAARLRYLQAELKEQIIINSARKARLLEIVQTRMAHQEYSSILEDLDNQVQQVYLRRTKTLGKSKKTQKRPGGAGGGSHYVAGHGSGAAGVGRPGIGDAARTILERRKKWIDSISPVFKEDVTRIPKETIFAPEVMAEYIAKEREGWEEGEE
ncbi:MAG: Transcriptional regulator [Lichina confinis]|nr:MAG: Transcriptional regulator [Lichina confinis]